MEKKSKTPVYVQDAQGEPVHLTRRNLWDKLKEMEAGLRLFILLISVVVGILSFYLTSLLQPVKQDIAGIQQRVDAQNQRIDTMEAYLIRIENKIDRVIESK